MSVVAAIVYTLFVWWFATGLALLLVLRVGRRACLAGMAPVFVLALYGLVRSGGSTSVGGVYVAFTAAILLWGTQEVAFLTGACTGPRPLACPPGARGWPRLRSALGAILYHELALIACGLAVLAATWHAPNQIGALTFLVLWVMRVSAKLNLFLGVPVLNDEVLPEPLTFLRSHFRQAPANAFFPVSVVASVLALSFMVNAAASAETGAATSIGLTLVATLLALAIVEHMFMLVPLPIARLWAWAVGKAPPPPRRPHDSSRDGISEEMKRVAVTSS